MYRTKNESHCTSRCRAIFFFLFSFNLTMICKVPINQDFRKCSSSLFLKGHDINKYWYSTTTLKQMTSMLVGLFYYSSRIILYDSCWNTRLVDRFKIRFSKYVVWWTRKTQQIERKLMMVVLCCAVLFTYL